VEAIVEVGCGRQKRPENWRLENVFSFVVSDQPEFFYHGE
jgi:hypothetical protein